MSSTPTTWAACCGHPPFAGARVLVDGARAAGGRLRAGLPGVGRKQEGLTRRWLTTTDTTLTITAASSGRLPGTAAVDVSAVIKADIGLVEKQVVFVGRA